MLLENGVEPESQVPPPFTVLQILLLFVPNQPCNESVHQKELFQPASPEKPTGSLVICVQVEPPFVV